MTALRRPRRGLAMVPALVCLVLATSICGALMKKSFARRTLVRAEERATQAEWLAEAGLARASVRLLATGEYRGESWEIESSQLADRGAAVVNISVTTPSDDSNRRFVHVQAEFPRGDERVVKLSKTLTIELGPDSSGGTK